MNVTNGTNQRSPKTTSLFPVVLYILNIPLTVLGNSLLCWVVYRYHRLRTPNNMLLASLSGANMLNVFVFVSRLVIYFSLEVEHRAAFCSILTVFYNNVLFLTTMHLCIISVDRMLAIKYPLRYPLWVTNRRALFFAIVLWVIFAEQLIRLVCIAADQDDFWKHMTRCYGSVKHATKHRPLKFNIIRIGAYILPFFVMLTSYGIIFKVVKTQSRKAYPETPKHYKRKSELKAAKTIGLLIGAFVILYTPLYICSAIRVIKVGETSPALKRSRKKILKHLGYLSSCASWINPVIYAFTNNDVKEHLKKLFKDICRKNR
ncbi:probable G-protein coupled receptor No9 [Actinia tenebrosa]|uniref:Probable G-protein coupled receptor No9 n=1 Tax=Actinia tenebrosa TaxID=6105 RepID=A0A6P8IWK0_ACTTE|nr:probable G-protein coupled receptor No9 [Actinia tenebrosa]